MRKREIYIENFNTNSIKNMAYEPVVYHGQQAFLRSYIRIERAKRAMLLERQFKKMVAIRIYAFSIRICVLSCILYLIGYSPPQGTIYVTVQKTDCFLHISITDEGGGFTPEALHHAQEQFFMGDKSRTSNMHFGMGLYITSSIIKQHGGQLVLSNSKKTGGAQVIIKIPY